MSLPSRLIAGSAHPAWRWMAERPWWVAIGAVLALQPLWPGLFDRTNALLTDSLVAAVPVVPASRIVAFDDASLRALGRWPWPRETHARILDELHAAGAQAVGYNVLFSEPSEAGSDAALARAVGAIGARLVLPVAPELDGEGRMVLRFATARIQAQARLGHVDVHLDRDGHVHRAFLRAGPGTPSLEAFPWAVLEASGLAPADMPGLTASTVLNPDAQDQGDGGWLRAHEVVLPPLRSAVPIDRYDGGALDATRYRDRVVFVGPTAHGVGPTYAVAGTAEPVPSVVLMAHAFEALRAGKAVTVLPSAIQWGLLGLVLAPVLLWRRQADGWRVAMPAATVAIPLVLAAVLANAVRWWWDPALAVLATVAACLTWGVASLRHRGEEIRRARLDAATALAAIGEGVVVVDAQGVVQMVNPAAQRMARQSQAVGRPFEEVFAVEEGAREFDAAPHGSDDTPGRVRAVAMRPAGAEQPVEVLMTAAPLPADPSGRAQGSVLALRDVTEMVAASRRIVQLATHDVLTGLPNRNLLLDRLRHALDRSARQGEKVAVLFIDLDRFKRVNDSLGHTHGDELLREMARRLRSICRVQDTVARWGGDEFVVVLEGPGGREGVVSAVGKLVERIGEEMLLSGLRFRCTCSVGIALSPDDSMDAEALLAKADSAMYRAKAHPGRRWEFYSQAVDHWTRDRIALEGDLRAGLHRGEFELHYQPQLRMHDGQLTGLEALLRWRKDGGALVGPSSFLPVAEESALILDLGQWVIHEAAQQVARWTREGGPEVPVSVNVSARQCLDHGLVATLETAMAEARIRPERLKIEITETAAMTDPPSVSELLGEVSRMGVGIALDDFGTGYSSLVHLRRFPIQQIKIDRSFVRDVDHDVEDEVIVGAIVALSRSLHIPVVAEGVETESQSRRLSALGCDMAQGYLYSHPLPAGALRHWASVH